MLEVLNQNAFFSGGLSLMVVGAVVVLLRKVPGQLWTLLQRRGRRYATNHRELLAGMRRLEFVPFLHPAIQSFIIIAFHSLTDPTFRFSEVYHRLGDCGMIIYPGKLPRVDTFRVGTIGRVFKTDIAQLLHAIEDVLWDISCTLPLDR